MDFEADIKTLDRDHCVAIWNRTLIHIWRNAPTPTAVQGMIDISRALLEKGGGPATCISIVERGSPPPEGKAREELARWSRDLVPKMALAVIVAEGSGFRAAMVRGVGIALTTVMPHRVPFKFVSRLDDAIPPLTPFLHGGGGETLRRAVMQLREKMVADFP